MTSDLTATLRQARDALSALTIVEPVEAALRRRVTREVDEALAQLSGAEAQRDLLSIVCHDLKDPLASIVMGAGFLKRTVPADDSGARRVIDAVARSADRMSQVVSDFHDLAKLEDGILSLERRPCDVVTTLHAAVASLEALAQERGIALTLDVPTDRPSALCDRARLIQIVSKLVGNAVRFTPTAGRIGIQVAADAKCVRISVRDSGRGIPPERIPTIFDRSANARRSPRDGPGLGLAIVRGLVELHGGEISVESRMGEGSSFVFTLPRA